MKNNFFYGPRFTRRSSYARTTGIIENREIYRTVAEKIEKRRRALIDRTMPETATSELATSVIQKNLHIESDGNAQDGNNGQLSEATLAEEEDDDVTAEDLAPDGGWGWMIVVAMILVYVTSTCAAPAFTMIFSDFFEATGQPGSTMTLLNSVFMISFSFSGLLTTALLKNYPMRHVGVTGAVLYSVPNVLSSLVYHVWQMALIFFVQGMGLGIMNTICNANFNAYWVKKRSKVMSGAHILIGLGGIVYPLLIERMMNVYGSRGTAAMIGALSLHCIVGMTMMHPVEWHAKDPDEVRKERARLADERRKLLLLSQGLPEKPGSVGGGKFVHPVLANRRSTIHGAQVFAKPSRWCSLTSLKEAGGGHEVPLLIESFRSRVASDAENGIRVRSRSGTNRASMVKRMSGLSGMSSSSIANIAAIGAAFVEIPHPLERKSRKAEKPKTVEETDKPEDEKETKPLGILSTVNALFELKHLENRPFMRTVLGISFVFTSDGTFASLLPLMMMSRGYATSDAALTITVSAATELISRIFLAVFTLFVDARPKVLFFLAMISIAFAKVGYLCFEHTLTGVLVSIAVIGMIRSWLYVPYILAVVENFPVEKHAAVYGIFSLVNGMTMIVFGPVVGFIKDWTDSYAICQLVLIILNCMFIVPWGMELLGVFRGNKKKAEVLKQNADDSRKTESQPPG